MTQTQTQTQVADFHETQKLILLFPKISEYVNIIQGLFH